MYFCGGSGGDAFNGRPERDCFNLKSIFVLAFGELVVYFDKSSIFGQSTIGHSGGYLGVAAMSGRDNDVGELGSAAEEDATQVQRA